MSSEIQILRFLASYVGHCHEWTRGQVVELPSPSIAARIDIVVIMFPRAEVETESGQELYHPAGLIVRNRGKYSISKSRAIAKAISDLLAQCEDYTPGSVAAHDDSEGMIGETDPAAYWIDLVEHPSALVKLQRAEVAAAKPAKPKTIKARRRNAGK